MGLLEQIIDSAASDRSSTTNLLRQVRTMAHRVAAADLSAWSLSELNGYAVGATLPSYRGPFKATVIGQWSGPFNTGGPGVVSAVGIPDDMQPWFQHEFRDSIAEIEEFAKGGNQLGAQWDPFVVGRYNELIDENRVPRIDGMYLVSANTVATPGLMRSVVEAVRTQALEMALELQSVSPSAGEIGGPTVSDKAVRSVVVQFHNHIYGDGANVAQGTGINQTSNVSAGDVVGLVRPEVVCGSTRASR